MLTQPTMFNLDAFDWRSIAASHPATCVCGSCERARAEAERGRAEVVAAADRILANGERYHAGAIDHDEFSRVAFAAWADVRDRGEAFEEDVRRMIFVGVPIFEARATLARLTGAR